MKRIYFAIVLMALTSIGFAQSTTGIKIKKADESSNWLFLDNAANLHPDKINIAIAKYMNLSEEVSFNLAKVKHDRLGFTHYRFEQYFSGHKVEGAYLILHLGPNEQVKANGRLVNGISISQAQLSEEQALEKAKEFIGADQYLWEIPEMEEFIKEWKKDENATYFPTGELVYSEKLYSQNGEKYTLNWKFEINARGKNPRSFVFVNSQSGEISYSLNGVHSDATEGTAVTRYSGTQTIITDSTGASNEDFILFDNTRGDGISTVNLNESEDIFGGVAVEFTDTDNFWDNANAEMDEVAGDMHWGLEMTYDYLLNSFNRDSYDGNGGTMIGFVHFGENVFNAFSYGDGILVFGDGYNNPLTSIDVIGHEMAHSMTNEEADLIYYAEPGALNESFSDIFGTAIEFYASPDSADWIIGRENFALRSMSDPNSYNDPDTYQGSYWVTGEQDNAGVHTNSSVQNKWFYLLSEGGSGVTDFGQEYELDGIGIIKAEAIAYRNLTVYLGQSSQYSDARMGAIQAAVDLYGECGVEVEQTIKAWHAVGLGYSELSKDMLVSEVELPESDCYLTDSESMEVTFTYYYLGCDVVLEAGEELTFGYRDNDGPEVIETLTLTEDMESGDELTYLFDENLDLSADGKHSIDVWVTIDDDFISANDTMFYQTTTHQVEITENEVIGFESITVSYDSIRVERGEYSEAKISSTADNSGSKGFKMTGYNYELLGLQDVDIEDVDWENYLDWPEDESDNFNTDPEYIASLCFCVDASEMETVWLAFDMKQLHSEFWFEYFGEDRTEFVSSMRIMVEGEQIGDQYHPDTYDDDPFITHYVDLSNNAGNLFEVCFQSKNFIRNAEDPVPGSTGDNTYLDNVRFIDDAALGIEESTISSFVVYPNPSEGKFFVEIEDGNTDYQLEIHDALGKKIYSKTITRGTNSLIEVDLSAYNNGIYLVKLGTENYTKSQRIIINH